MGEKREGFTGTTIKDSRRITRGRETGGRWRGLGWWGRVRGRGRKLYLTNNKNQKYLIINK